jgi:DhnA family fructose-bisphosphate aldolase class Ia
MPGEPDLLEGIEDMEAVVDALVAADPEALLLTPGQAELLQRKVGRAKPALVLRVDTGNVFGREVPERPASWMYDDPAGLAVRADAACVIVNLLDSPGQPSLRETCVQNIMRLRAECDRASMPMMVEPVPMAPNTAGYDVHRDAERLRGLVRQATELGADLIKCDPLPDQADFAASCAPPACRCSCAAAGASRRRGHPHHRRGPGRRRGRPRLRAQRHPARRPHGDDPRPLGAGPRARDGRRGAGAAGVGRPRRACGAARRFLPHRGEGGGGGRSACGRPRRELPGIGFGFRA